jgi:hypothetical protein
MNFVQVRSFDNYINANLQLSMLQDEGIQCYLKDEYTITIDPLLSPAIGGMKLMVYESQWQRAMELIEAADKKYLHTFSCPRCGKHSLELVTEIKKPSGLWQKIMFLLVNGQAEEVKRYYQCTSCQSKFDELSPANPDQ